MEDTQFLILEDGPDLESLILQATSPGGSVTATNEIILVYKEGVWHQAVVSPRWGVEFRIVPGQTEKEVKELFLKTRLDKVARKFPVINRCYRVWPATDPRLWQRKMAYNNDDAVFQYRSEYNLWDVRVGVRRDYEMDDVKYNGSLVKRYQAEHRSKWDHRIKVLQDYVLKYPKSVFYIFCQQDQTYLRKGGYGTTKLEEEAGVFDTNQALEMIEDLPFERGIKLIKVKGVNFATHTRNAVHFKDWDSL